MPRQRSAGRAPSRPTAAPARPAPAPQQTRSATTAAYPPAAQRPAQTPATQQPAQSAGSGLFGQMATTAAGVAIGSSVGHAITGLWSGSGSSAPAEVQQQPTQSYEQPKACEVELQKFRSCLDTNNGDMNICSWYLDSLKGCMAAASPH